MTMFKDTDTILFVSENLLAKQQIEDGIYRKLTTIHSPSEFIEEIEKARSFGRANVIIYKNVSDEFKPMANHFFNVLQVLLNDPELDIVIITIEMDKFLEGRGYFNFGSIDTFTRFAKKHDRIAQMIELQESQNENDRHGAKIIRELMAENEAYEGRVKNTDELEERYQKEIKELEAEIISLEHEINTVYKVELETSSDESERYIEKIKELERKLEIEKKKMEDYTNEANTLRDLNKNLELDLDSVNSYLEDVLSELKVSKKQVQALINENEQNKLMHSKLLNSQVDSEKFAILQKEYANEQKNTLNLKNELNKVLIESKKKDMIINEVRSENAVLRQGDIDLEKLGRTNRLDTHIFERMNVFYFKIIHELPYFNSQILVFRDNLKKLYGDDVTICILKYDEGIDSRLYEGIEVHSTLGDVPRDTDLFLLYPSQRMMTNADDFESKYGTVIFIDFIQSNDYYLDSHSICSYFNVVRYSSDVKRLGLKGHPISVDANSVMKIAFDEAFLSAQVSETKKTFLNQKVLEFMRIINLIQ